MITRHAGRVPLCRCLLRPLLCTPVQCRDLCTSFTLSWDVPPTPCSCRSGYSISLMHRLLSIQPPLWTSQRLSLCIPHIQPRRRFVPLAVSLRLSARPLACPLFHLNLEIFRSGPVVAEGHWLALVLRGRFVPSRHVHFLCLLRTGSRRTVQKTSFKRRASRGSKALGRIR